RGSRLDDRRARRNGTSPGPRRRRPHDRLPGARDGSPPPPRPALSPALDCGGRGGAGSSADGGGGRWVSAPGAPGGGPFFFSHGLGRGPPPTAPAGARPRTAPAVATTGR